MDFVDVKESINIHERYKETNNLYNYAKNNVYLIDKLGLYFSSKGVSKVMVRALPDNPTQDDRRKYQNWKNNTNFQTLIDYIDDNVYCLQCIAVLKVFLHGNKSGTRTTFASTNIFSYNTDASIITKDNVGVLFMKLMDEEVFCSKCVIYWMACFSGVGNIPQVIADTTGCTVYAPLGKLKGLESFNESKTLNSKVYDIRGNELPRDKSFKKFTRR